MKDEIMKLNTEIEIMKIVNDKINKENRGAAYTRKINGEDRFLRRRKFFS